MRDKGTRIFKPIMARTHSQENEDPGTPVKTLSQSNPLHLVISKHIQLYLTVSVCVEGPRMEIETKGECRKHPQKTRNGCTGDQVT